MKSFSKFLAEDAVDDSFIYFIAYPSIKNPKNKNLYVGIRYGKKNIGPGSLFAGIRTDFENLQIYHTNEDLWLKCFLRKDMNNYSQEDVKYLTFQRQFQLNYMTSSASDHPESLFNVYRKAFLEEGNSDWHPRIISENIYIKMMKKQNHDTIYKYRKSLENEYPYHVFSAQNINEIGKAFMMLASGAVNYDDKDVSDRVREVAKLFWDARHEKDGVLNKKFRNLIDNANKTFYNELVQYHIDTNLEMPKRFKFDNTQAFIDQVYANMLKLRNRKGLISFLEAFVVKMLFGNLVSKTGKVKKPTQTVDSDVYPNRGGGREFFEEIYLPEEFSNSQDKTYRSKIIEYFCPTLKHYNWLSKMVKHANKLRETNESYLTEFSTSSAETQYLSKLGKMNKEQLKTNRNGFLFAKSVLEGKSKFNHIFLEMNGKETKISLEQLKKTIVRKR